MSIIIILGDGGVGKSTITLRIVRNEFIEEYDPTVEDFYRFKRPYTNKVLEVLLPFNDS
jgi:GTPase KRas protein